VLLLEVAEEGEVTSDGVAVLDAKHDGATALGFEAGEGGGGAGKGVGEGGGKGDGGCRRGDGGRTAVNGARGSAGGDHLTDAAELAVCVLGGGGAALGGEGALGDIGDHDGGIQAALGHLVEIDEDARVTLVEVDVLVEEHGCVTVAVEGEDAAVDAACLAVVSGLGGEPAEEGEHGVVTGQGEAFGMPLHAKNALVLRRFHSLDDAVWGGGRDTEMRARITDGLMVEAVDGEGAGVHDTVKEGAFCKGHGVRGDRAIQRLGVLQKRGREAALGRSRGHSGRGGSNGGGNGEGGGRGGNGEGEGRGGNGEGGAELCGEVLPDGAVKGGGKQLDASADAEDGQLAVKGQADKEQLGEVAAGIDASEGGDGFLAEVEGIEVCAAGEEEAVDAVKHGDEGIAIGGGRQDDGDAAGTEDALEVALGQLTAFVAEIARDAYHGLVLCAGEGGMEAVINGFPIEHRRGEGPRENPRER